VPPNIVYLHSHDTGRYVQPYGHRVPTPNIQRLAEQGVLFRQAFSAAPVCSPSRAALLTGEYSHANGMLGLAHRGYRLTDYRHHLVHTLRDAGYTSALVGEQHLSIDPADLGYDRVVEVASNRARDVAPAAAALRLPEPFFLSVGFFETHRDFPLADDARYTLPPANLPDTAATRADMAGFDASARALDDGVGTVLDALAEDTLVILTTDHGLAFPGAKATLTDRGIGVMLIVRGPGFRGGEVSDALVSQIDIFPTLCDLAGIERPAWLCGTSLLGEPRDAVFAEITYHAAYEPQRAVRTRRYKYIQRFDNGHQGPVLANIDDSPSKDYLLDHGLADRVLPAEELYDLVLDPSEAANIVAEQPTIAAELRARLARWMEETDDPLLRGPVEPAAGTQLNHPQQRSPSDPTTTA
jgi:N-sulfoglucosamine sulfohydrolase